MVISLISGATFGVLPVLFLDPAQFEVMAWILLILSGLAGGALGTLSAYSPAFIVYIVASVAPLVAVLLYHQRFDLGIIAALFLMMGLYFMRFSRGFETALSEQIRGRLENIDLADRMTRQGAVLRSVMESIPNAILVIDRNGRFLYYNDQFRALFDLPEELLNDAFSSRSFNALRRDRGDFDHLDRSELQDQLTHWERLRNSDQPFDYERVRADGRILRVENHPMPDGGWVRSWIDITEAKRAEAETARKSALLQLTLDNIDQGISVIDQRGHVAMVNHRYCDLLDLPENIIDRPLDDIIAEQRRRGDLDALTPEIQAELDRWEAGEAREESLIYERQQANGRWLLVFLRRLPDGGHVRTFTDITGRKQAETSAAERRELLELTLRSIDQGLIMRNSDDRIELYNERLAELLGVPIEMYERNASSQELNDYHDAQDYPFDEKNAKLVDDWIARRLAGEPVGRLEYQRESLNGSWLHVVFSPLPEGREIRTFTDITPMKRVERELREKTLFLEAVLASMEQGVLVTDTGGQVTLWNDRFREILSIPEPVLEERPNIADGRSASKRDSLKDTAAVDPQDWRHWIGLGGETRTFTYERRLDDGRWVLVYGRQLPGGGTVRTLTDITLRKHDEEETLRAKEEAERAREHLRAAIEVMPAGVVIHDSELNFQIWNETYKEISGLSEEDLVSLKSFDRVAESRRGTMTEGWGIDFDDYLRRRRQLYDRRQPMATTEHWTGVNRHIELRINPIPTGGWVSIYIDMTRRIESQREIAEQSRVIAQARDVAESTRERMQGILQSIPVGVLVYDANMEVEFWNGAYCSITGFPASVLEKKPNFIDYSKFIFRAHERGKDMSLDRFMEYRRGVYQSGEHYSREFFFDKTRSYVQYVVSSLPDGGRINVIMDITPQKQAERAAIEARDLAEEATRAKSDFLAAMSHEIRTPMNGVIGMAELLANTHLDAEQKTITLTIQESGSALLRIIDDILDFSKVEAGRMELETEPVALIDLAEGVLDTVAHAAEEKDLDLALRVDEGAPAAVLCDPVRLRQVLLNLVGNAVKFTEHGSVALVLRGREDPEGRHQVLLRFDVIDTGIGIAEDRIDQLFEPFRQAEASTTRRFGGTGLGLAICERLVTLMGGRIGVESALGEGSRFWVEIPVSQTKAARHGEIGLDQVAVGLTVREGPTRDRIVHELLRHGAHIAEPSSGGEKQAVPDLSIVDGRLGRAAIEAGLDVDPTGPGARKIWICPHGDGAVPPVAISRPVRRLELLSAIAVALGRQQVPVLHDSESDEPLETGTEVPTVEEALARNRLILVAEDHPTNRRLVLSQLAMLGFAAEAAVDGEEALEMWRSGRYALLLADCHMPHLDGYQLAAAIRLEEADRAEQTGERGRTPIIALTANALSGEAERCVAAGMNDYLAKPVTLGLLKDILGRWLGGAGSPPNEREEPTADGDEPPTVDAEGPPIDEALLAEVLGTSDRAEIGAMLDLFLTAFTEAAEAIEGAIETRDAGRLREAAHSAKGAAANAAALPLRDTLAAIERSALVADWDSMQGLRKELAERIEAVRTSVALMMAGTDPGAS